MGLSFLMIDYMISHVYYAVQVSKNWNLAYYYEVMVGMVVFTVLIAVIPSLICILIAEWNSITDRYTYGLGGFFIGVLALVPALFIPHFFFAPLAGLVGGLIYWRIVGRYAGSWKYPKI
jgi:hypothetical protein